MRIVLDTNVIVSGFLSPYHAPGAIVQMVSDLTLRLCYDARVFSEYEEVLARHKFSFNPEKVEAFLEQVKVRGERAVARPLSKSLPDQTDQMFLEVALAGKAECLVTGNLRHFPKALCQGMGVFSPPDFLDFYRKAR